jgi:hypothetical protein
MIDFDKRKMEINEFEDNEYFSNFESLIYQINPDDQHIEFSVLIHMP